MDPRTRLLLEAPIARTLLKLGAPNLLVMFAQAAVGLIETFFVGKLGTDALAGWGAADTAQADSSRQAHRASPG